MNSTELRETITNLIPCIDDTCDKHGTAMQGTMDDPEPLQCQYCYEVRFPAIDKIMHNIKDHVVYVIGDNELVQKTDDIQEIDVSMNNAEVINEEKAKQRNRAGAY